MSLPVVRQLDAEQHQAEPGLQELFVGGGEVVGQALGLQVGEDAAGSSVTQERAEVSTGRGAVVGLVVRQGEGEVEVVALRSTNITQHLHYTSNTTPPTLHQVEVVALRSTNITQHLHYTSNTVT